MTKKKMGLLSIIALATLIRSYRMKELAVFLADQASDSSKVLDIIGGNPTLLGPITSVGGFYNGPVVYYLMLPFYLIFQGNPLSGTIFQTVFSIATIPILYLIGKELKNHKLGLIAAFLFSISPLMIEYSRAAFNAFPAIFFSTLILFTMLRLLKQCSFKYVLILGISVGFIVQMHYFTVVFIPLAVLLPFIKRGTLHRFHYYLVVFLGFLIGLSPFIVFELTHQFLNLQLLLSYLGSQASSQTSISYSFAIWPRVVGELLLGNNFLLSLAGILLIVATVIYASQKNKVDRRKLSLFVALLAFVFLLNLAYQNELQLHYVISVHTTLILLFSLGLYYIFEKNKGVALSALLIVTILNSQAWNIGKASHPIQDGLTIGDFQKAATIIYQDEKGKYNVGMHAQGDNRAMPLRYMLKLHRDYPEPYENYSDIETLYFVVRKNEPVESLKMWEYTQFLPSSVVDQWEINQEYNLYKLRKN